MKNRWERRDAKEHSKRRFVSDNRRSVQVSSRMGYELDKPKQTARKRYR
jgi:hypothetical protein